MERFTGEWKFLTLLKGLMLKINQFGKCVENNKSDVKYFGRLHTWDI